MKKKIDPRINIPKPTPALKEISGDIWDYYGRGNYVICVTTNGEVNSRGAAVMGRGIAKQATAKVAGIDFELGRLMMLTGQCGPGVHLLDQMRILSFPTKHHWKDPADLDLIYQSAQELWKYARAFEEKNFILPRPGCGNGRLGWEEVRPRLRPLFGLKNVMVIHQPITNND